MRFQKRCHFEFDGANCFDAANIIAVSSINIIKTEAIDVYSATRPNTGGPSRNPLYPSVETLAIAAPGDTEGSSAALLKQTGIKIA